MGDKNNKTMQWHKRAQRNKGSRERERASKREGRGTKGGGGAVKGPKVSDGDEGRTGAGAGTQAQVQQRHVPFSGPGYH